MEHFGDRLAAAVAAKGPICVGLDPRLERIPPAVRAEAERESTPEARARVAIARFHRVVIDAVADRVPVVKLQLAFYEQYGIPGLLAYQDTVAAAREAGMLVIADAKRNDVPSTAEAYARAFLQPGSERPDGLPPAFEADALTVNPYLGRDSLMPFVDRAATAGKGLFVLVKTSNPGSGDLQDLGLADGRPLHLAVADLVTDLGRPLVGASGYSPIAAVVGCTHPEPAAEIRSRLPHAFVLAVGYGAQAGDALGAAHCFQPGGRGAIVNASRSLTYELPAQGTIGELGHAVRANVDRMAADLEAGTTVPG
jgi:orotidine-5'-phosphate decarboxylase